MGYERRTFRFVDLFCGIGGFRVAMEQACARLNVQSKCVFSCDIDPHCRQSYGANFGDVPAGDITTVDADEIPRHDVLFAGFPCQPFSIIGQRRGFDDARGTLFFHIARLLQAKRPPAFVLENVKQLVGHNQGQTLRVILDTLHELGYEVRHTVLNALDYGLPQKRERIFLVGTRPGVGFAFPPRQMRYTPLGQLLEAEVPQQYYASEYIRSKRQAAHASQHAVSIWHENKGGHISSYPYSCALRAAGSYNYLLVNGERRLTPREMFRLQGFPDTYHIAVSDSQARRQAGNAVPVNVVRAILEQLLPSLMATQGAECATR